MKNISWTFQDILEMNEGNIDNAIQLHMRLTIKEFDDLLQLWRTRISSDIGIEVSRKDVLSVLLMTLGDKNNIEHPANTWDIPINFEKGLKIFFEFDFNAILNPIELDLDIESILIAPKAKVKAAGFILYIHKYDQDPFPSNPHAHIVDQNIKIDLSNGNCYRNRILIKTIKIKELLEIRKKAEAVKIELPLLEISA